MKSKIAQKIAILKGRSLSNRIIGESLDVSFQTIARWADSVKEPKLNKNQLDSFIKLLQNYNVYYKDLLVINNNDSIKNAIYIAIVQKKITTDQIVCKLPFYVKQIDKEDKSDFVNQESFQADELSQLLAFLEIDLEALNIDKEDLYKIDLDSANREISRNSVKLYSLTSGDILQEDFIINDYPHKAIAIKVDTEHQIIDKDARIDDILILKRHELTDNDPEFANKYFAYLYLEDELDKTYKFSFLKSHLNIDETKVVYSNNPTDELNYQDQEEMNSYYKDIEDIVKSDGTYGDTYMIDKIITSF